MKPAVVVLFEDDGYNLLWPLAATRPVWELRLGGHTLGEKLKGQFPGAQFAYVGRPDVIAALEEDEGPMPRPRDLRIQGDVLWLNGRALADERWLDAIALSKGPMRWCVGARVLALAHSARMTPDVIGQPALFTRTDTPAGPGFVDEEVDAPFVDAIWDLLRHNHQELLVEGELAVRAAHGAELAPRNNPALSPGAHVIEAAGIALHPTARIAPGCVLDASGGPIVVERDAVLEPHTYVAGPCWIGAGTHVLGGKLGGGVALGPGVPRRGRGRGDDLAGLRQQAPPRLRRAQRDRRVGEPRARSPPPATSRTTTARCACGVDGAERDSEENKIGSIIGAHVKTGIGTLLPTGAVIGAGVEPVRRRPLRARASCRRSRGGTASARRATRSRSSSRPRASCAPARARASGDAQEQLYRTIASRRPRLSAGRRDTWTTRPEPDHA